MRLVGNQLGVEGLVQVYYKSTWGWVGTDHWDKLDGDVVCREMGFSKSLSLIKDASIGTYDYDGKQSQTTWMNNLQCIGNESSLLSCVNDGWRPHQNFHKRMAGVVCSHQKGKALQ